MGVTRRSVVGGALAGLGDALLMLGENRVRRRQRQQEIADQRAWEIEKAQIDSLGKLGDQIAADPSQASRLLQGASMNPLLARLDLSGMRPPDPAIVAALKQKISKVEDPTDLPNAEDVAGVSGLDTTPIPAANPQDSPGAQFQDPSMPSSTFEQTNPSVRPVAQAVIDRRNALKQQQEDKIATERRTAEAKSYGTASGTNRAENENAPTALRNEVTKAETLGPVNARNAGLEAGARTDAENTPDRQRAKARGAGMVASAQESARVAAEKAIRASGLSPQQQQAALQLSDNFRQEATTFKVKEENFRTILSVSKNPSAAGDLAMIFSYMRMLDPGSTVREGEFANAQNAAGVPEQVRRQYNMMLNGERLTPVMRQDFLDQAFANYTGSKAGQDRIIKDYTARSLAMGVDPSLVVRQTDPELDKPPVSTPNANTPQTPAGFRVLGSRPVGAK